MTTMPQDLRTFIIGSTAVSTLVGSRCHYNKLPEHSERPHIWFRVPSDTEELTMDGAGGIHDAQVDIECVARNEDDAQAVADALKPRLHGYKGTFGNISAKGMFLSDKDDDYIPASIPSDDGFHVIAYGLRVVYST